MHCQDFEQDIYTYGELTKEEQARLSEHIAGCQPCQKLFQEVLQMNRSVASVAMNTPVPANAAHLTHSIMTRVQAATSAKWLLTLERIMQQRVVLLPATAASMALILFFLVELWNGFDSPASQAAPKDRATVLDIKAFRQKAAQRKEARHLYAECLSPYKSSFYQLDCIKGKSKKPSVK